MALAQRLLGRFLARKLNRLMSVLLTSSKRPPPEVTRFVQVIDTVQPSHALPAHVSEDDYFKTRNGGWVSKIPETVEKDSFLISNQFTYTKEDPVVRVDYTYYFNGHFESESGAGDGVTPFPVPFEWVASDAGVTKEYSTRGTESYHGSREPQTLDNRKYIRTGGLSIQNWRIVFDEYYDRVLVTEITNCEARFDTWHEPDLTVGAYERRGNTLWVGGGQGAVAFRYEPQTKVYTQDYGGNSNTMKTDKVGLWKCVTELTYLSGFTQSYTHEYEVTGDPGTNFSDIQLIPGNWPVETPIYKEQWQAIKGFWTGKNALIAAAVQDKIDAAPSAPTSASHPNEFSLDSQSAPPADIQMAVDIVTTGATTSSDGITVFESLVASNPIQAALNELNHYAQIVKSWADLADSTANANLKAVASANRQFTDNFAERSRAAHNGWISFDEADAGWKLYEQYSKWAIKQTPNELQNMEVWDLVLNRPS